MSETGKDTISPNLLDTVRINWPEFSRLLDDYRDAAYWAGYKDAKSEILELYAKGDK